MRKNISLILCFFIGHAIFHFLSQSFAVLLPSIQETFQVTAIQIGALITVREAATGIIALPGGLVSDYFSKQRGRILTICLVLSSVGWFMIASAPIYSVLYISVLVIATAKAVWHLPSLVELGARFPEKRGTIFAIHGAGGSFGDVTGPVATGVLLSYLAWRDILTIYTILPLIIAVWTFLLFRRLRRERTEEIQVSDQSVRVDLREQLKVSRDILRTTDIWLVNVVAGLRTMCFAVLITFLPIYMHDSGFSPASIGFHFGLLWAIGLVASPLMGHLSDRFGRKIVLVPALLYSSVMVSVLAFYGTGSMFTVLIILLGLSVRSDYSIINATIIDMVKGRVENTMLGILTFSRSLVGSIAPLIAGFLYQYSGMRATLIFVGGLFFLASLVFALARLDRSA